MPENEITEHINEESFSSEEERDKYLQMQNLHSVPNIGFSEKQQNKLIKLSNSNAIKNKKKVLGKKTPPTRFYSDKELASKLLSEGFQPDIRNKIRKRDNDLYEVLEEPSNFSNIRRPDYN